MYSIAGAWYISLNPPNARKTVLRMAPQPAQNVTAVRGEDWCTKQCSRLRYWDTKVEPEGERSYDPISASRLGSPSNSATTLRIVSEWTHTSASINSKMSPEAARAPMLRAQAGPRRPPVDSTFAPCSRATSPDPSVDPS